MCVHRYRDTYVYMLIDQKETYTYILIYIYTHFCLMKFEMIVFFFQLYFLNILLFKSSDFYDQKTF